MDYRNRQLIREIRQVKQESFPELKWVYFRGIYVPDYEVLKTKSLARIRIKALAKSNETKLFWAIGFGKIILAESLSSPEHYTERRGIIAHELSHFVVAHNSEQKIDDEAIKRGYVFELMKAVKILESIGVKRKPLSYGSADLMEMLE